MDTLQRIRDVGILPVVRAASSAEALAAVEAIRAGGIPILEITLTVPTVGPVVMRILYSPPGTSTKTWSLW